MLKIVGNTFSPSVLIRNFMAFQNFCIHGVIQWPDLMRTADEI